MDSSLSKTAVVLVTDKPFLYRAERTIKDIRSRGEWTGDIVLISVDFIPSIDFINNYKVTIYPVKHIDVSPLVEIWKSYPIKPMADQRHTKKLAQWNKLYVFDEYFLNWDRVIYFDAGLRVVGSINPLLDLDYKDKFIAPDDGCTNGSRFISQMDWDANPSVTKDIFDTFGEDIVKAQYFMNCMWLYDTAILHTCSKKDLEEGMKKYPISLCNEMGIMNLYFTYIHKVWQPLPEKTADGKWLYAWCESNYAGCPKWSNFHYIKYPITISFNMD